jgi:hypothetical protein
MTHRRREEMSQTGLHTYDCHTWATFVSSGVNVTPATRTLIETIMPYYPSSCRCITGYQDEEGQFWKVNYHWDLIDHMLDKALALNLSAPFPSQLQALKQQLKTNAPVPKHGYMNSPTEGLPKDASSHDQIIKRWEMLAAAKKAFSKIITDANIKTLAPPVQRWDLAVAKVAKPGTSNHGKGYALDIEGKGHNAEIKHISALLGATQTFDEASHVHVEFKNGVVLLIGVLGNQIGKPRIGPPEP